MSPACLPLPCIHRYISFITVNCNKEKLLKILVFILLTPLISNNMHVAVVEMTVIQDRDATVPRVAWSGEYEAGLHLL